MMYALSSRSPPDSVDKTPESLISALARRRDGVQSGKGVRSALPALAALEEEV